MSSLVATSAPEPPEYTACERALCMPELLEKILRDLHPVYLFDCSLVSRTFTSVASPILWRHVVTGQATRLGPDWTPKATAVHACRPVLARHTKVLTLRPHISCRRLPLDHPDYTVNDPTGRNAAEFKIAAKQLPCQLPNVHTMIMDARTVHAFGYHYDCLSFCQCLPCDLVVRVRENQGIQMPMAGLLDDKMKTLERVTFVLDHPLDKLLINPHHGWDDNIITHWIHGILDAKATTIVLLPSDMPRDPTPQRPPRQDKWSKLHKANLSFVLNPDIIALAKLVVTFFIKVNTAPSNIYGEILTGQAGDVDEIPPPETLETKWKLRIFDLQPRSHAKRVYVRKNVRRYAFQLFSKDDTFTEWVDTMTREDFDKWYGDCVEWGGIRKFLSHAWDNVFETWQIEEIVKIFKRERLPTDYSTNPDSGYVSDYESTRLAKRDFFNPHKHVTAREQPPPFERIDFPDAIVDRFIEAYYTDYEGMEDDYIEQLNACGYQHWIRQHEIEQGTYYDLELDDLKEIVESFGDKKGKADVVFNRHVTYISDYTASVYMISDSDENWRDEGQIAYRYDHDDYDETDNYHDSDDPENWSYGGSYNVYYANPLNVNDTSSNQLSDSEDDSERSSISDHGSFQPPQEKNYGSEHDDWDNSGVDDGCGNDGDDGGGDENEEVQKGYDAEEDDDDEDRNGKRPEAWRAERD